MRFLLALLIGLAPPALAQDFGGPPQPPQPRPAPGGAGPYPYPVPGDGGHPPGGYQPGYGSGGCYNCGGFSGNYYGSNVVVRPPAPPLRLQGQWRNGWWYY